MARGARPPRHLGDELGVAKLEGFDRLWSLNLAGTLINDRALETVSTMKSLHELSLVDTAITDCAVAYLSELWALRQRRNLAIT